MFLKQTKKPKKNETVNYIAFLIYSFYKMWKIIFPTI